MLADGTYHPAELRGTRGLGLNLKTTTHPLAKPLAWLSISRDSSIPSAAAYLSENRGVQGLDLPIASARHQRTILCHRPHIESICNCHQTPACEGEHQQSQPLLLVEWEGGTGRVSNQKLDDTASVLLPCACPEGSRIRDGQGRVLQPRECRLHAALCMVGRRCNTAKPRSPLSGARLPVPQRLCCSLPPRCVCPARRTAGLNKGIVRTCQ